MKNKSKHSSFKVPKGYFENLSSDLLSKIEDNKVTQEIPDNGMDAFKMPNDYFNTLHKKIAKKLPHNETKVISLYKRYYYAAASIAAILILAIFIKNSSDTTRQDAVSFSDLASVEIEAYFDNYDVDLSDHDLAEVLPVQELYLSDISDYQLNEESITDYLSQNIEDSEVLNILYDE